MNGIIHQCTHPNDDEVVVMNIEAMFERMFQYTERLYRIVRPKKVMYLAVDGVAPRAKMNQQRARRFRSAKDAERTMAEAIARGDNIPKDVETFDSNCITPGTAFMADLSVRFQDWINDKIATDPAWQTGCSIIFSGPDVPGEGEHKIMDFIRRFKASSQWSPAVRHCMYGLDADLIMLGLVTHEAHFTLLREKIRWRKGKKRAPKANAKISDADEFELLELGVLRDMIYMEFKPNSSRSPRRGSWEVPSRPHKQFDYNVDSVVDDFIFMVMLVGNDFIPHIPNLDIAEGALNLMFRVYKDLLPQWGGYLTKVTRLHPERLEEFIAAISKSERAYFEARGLEEGEKGFTSPDYAAYYYKKKLDIDVKNPAPVRSLVQVYLEGLHWVLHYYHAGCPSWNWFYPLLYGPLASDLHSLRKLPIAFRKGKPFRPLCQLLSVLPPESARLLPGAYQELMVAENSPLREFYPREFTVDPNGKKNAWEAVVIIPFIEEKRLLEEADKIDPAALTEEERSRDVLGKEHVFRSKTRSSSQPP
eukprot:CAMPEP_0174894908 /NCGR_PEP_ID=MMETSP0167-20121228/9426_1 /TAXON_ID=38298 /ORGANISM="Rhodella maculata, Strain CCMP736" /LENGTH=532 /DNA_ID=CAMNT_0016134109 /DNA_START=135 /DNA_END=1730 /DNA_ORIENTATION=+